MRSAARIGFSPTWAAIGARKVRMNVLTAGRSLADCSSGPWMGHAVCPTCHAKLVGEIVAVKQAVARRIQWRWVWRVRWSDLRRR